MGAIVLRLLLRPLDGHSFASRDELLRAIEEIWWKLGGLLPRGIHAEDLLQMELRRGTIAWQRGRYLVRLRPRVRGATPGGLLR